MPKTKKKCTPLKPELAGQFARLLLSQTENTVHRGADRKKRITAPSGCVMLF